MSTESGVLDYYSKNFSIRLFVDTNDSTDLRDSNNSTDSNDYSNEPIYIINISDVSQSILSKYKFTLGQTTILQWTRDKLETLLEIIKHKKCNLTLDNYEEFYEFASREEKSQFLLKNFSEESIPLEKFLEFKTIVGKHIFTLKSIPSRFKDIFEIVSFVIVPLIDEQSIILGSTEYSYMLDCIFDETNNTYLPSCSIKIPSSKSIIDFDFSWKHIKNNSEIGKLWIDKTMSRLSSEGKIIEKEYYNEAEDNINLVIVDNGKIIEIPPENLNLCVIDETSTSIECSCSYNSKLSIKILLSNRS